MRTLDISVSFGDGPPYQSPEACMTHCDPSQALPMAAWPFLMPDPCERQHTVFHQDR
ncbi:MAG: hypothetical protein MI923_26340 [Phycisphaerales bacterium]|nr:hypothetical protein [Phycisphaerales bacterium]